MSVSDQSFKGNLDVLNLSDILQSLAMNRRSGTLIVMDGKREKKIYFSEGEIALLSTTKRMKLGQLLVSTGKIAEDDLELALRLQKQSRRKIGEILVEEGFCDEDDIARIVKFQIEEEIYDLFLWRHAEFEFIANFMPDELQHSSTNLLRLSLNTNSLLLEALRRMDEWEMIRQHVPTTKEIFFLPEGADLEPLELPARLRQELERLDERTNVEMLAERIIMSEFDLCKILAELVQDGTIRPITRDENIRFAEEAYVRLDYHAGAVLYGRLVDDMPGEVNVLIPLADCRRRIGEEREALEIYERIREHLEGEGGDSENLMRCYEAILVLDPERSELYERLEELRSQMSSRSKNFLVPILVVAVIALVGIGVAIGLRGRQGGEGEDVIEEEPRDFEREAEDLLKEHYRARSEGDWELMHAKGMAIAGEPNYADTKAHAKVQLPVRITTIPLGFEVVINGLPAGITSKEKPYIDHAYYPNEQALRVEIKRPKKAGGTGKVLAKKDLDWQKFHDISIPVYSEFDWRVGVPGPAEGRIVASEQALMFPCRAGLFILLDHDTGDVKGRMELGFFGDRYSPPVLHSDRVYVGCVSDEDGVVEIALSEKPTIAKRYASSGPVLGRPLISAAGDRLYFASYTGDVRCYAVGQPAKAIWRKNYGPLGVRMPFGGILVAQGEKKEALYVLASTDDCIRALRTADGGRAWSYHTPDDPIAPPIKIGQNGIVIATREQVVALDGRNGRELWRPVQLGAMTSIAARGDALFVSTRSDVRAIDGATGKPLWPKAFSGKPGRGETRIGVGDSLLLVTFGDERVFGLDPKTGEIAWQGMLKRGDTILSPLVVVKGALVVGTSGDVVSRIPLR